jgi:hypothetical protein
MNGHLEVVKVLVASGADASIRNEAGRDAVVESEMSSKEEAKACAEWMLKNCEGLDKGVRGGIEEEGDAEDVLATNTVAGSVQNGDATEQKIQP